jgi:endonuclease/exonuclease/phosphatase (EEP) superfamily protein YafD
MSEPTIESPTNALPPTLGTSATLGLRICKFLFDIVALLILLLTIFIAVLWLVALWFDGDVSEVSGNLLRVVAVVFFFRVFQFYAAITLLVAGLIVLLLKYRRLAVAPLVLAFILGMPFIRSFLPRWPPAVNGPALKVYSANLFSMNRDGDAIVRSIRAENPDVIVLMEVTSWSYKLLTDTFGTEYRFLHRPHYNGAGMVMSRVPFSEMPPVVRLPGNHTRVPLVFEIGGKQLAMYPVHLVSPGQLRYIAQNREQIRELLKIDENEGRPMMIVGDCNVTPQTPNFGALNRAGFRSSYQLAGFGLCTTWGPRWWPRLNALPGVQIDQILLQPPLTVKSHKVGLDTGSDHRPIVAEIGFAN